tara:strand:+ start:6078 stop:6338 length:261 start_codon:yes stop_codon:yes gene_type:complete
MIFRERLIGKAKRKYLFFKIQSIVIKKLNMDKLIEWHKSFIERAQKQLGISNYALYWLGFLEGALVMWILFKVASFFNNESADIPF